MIELREDTLIVMNIRCYRSGLLWLFPLGLIPRRKNHSLFNWAFMMQKVRKYFAGNLSNKISWRISGTLQIPALFVPSLNGSRVPSVFRYPPVIKLRFLKDSSKQLELVASISNRTSAMQGSGRISSTLSGKGARIIQST